MKDKVVYYILAFSLLLIVSCTSRKSLNPDSISDVNSIAVTDSIRPDSLHYPSPDEFMDGHTPPPPPPPPHGKNHPPHESDNMRGFDPASEDDMEDNGMSRYMENNDEEGWD